ncbi:hypothetical protein ABPG72_010526 [Tetrahymena utriculariae]
MDYNPPLHNAVILKEAEEKRLDELFNQFAKQDQYGHLLKFSELFQLALDRNIIGTKVSFSVLYDLFLDCVDENQQQQQLEEENQQNMKKPGANKPQDKTLLKNQEIGINKAQFNFLLFQLSRIIYPTERSHFERMFQEILSEKTIVNKGSIEILRCPLFDDITKKLLLETTIQVLCEYEEELRNCYVSYISENYFQQKLLLTWNEIALQRKKMSTFALLMFLKESHVIPNVLSVENVNESMMKIIPAVSGKEIEFYHKHYVVQIYEKQIPEGVEKPVEHDPRLEFHEFQLCLARIAYEMHPKDQEKNMKLIMEKFFGDIIGIRKNDRIGLDNFPNINKKLYKKLDNYYKDIEIEERGYNGEQDEGSDSDLEDPMQMLAKMQEQQIFQADLKEVDMHDIFTTLNKDLPPLPDIPKLEQENPPPYKKDPLDKKKDLRVVIGQPVPKPPPEKGKPKPKPPKKKQLKKGEKPPRKIIWAGMPPPPPSRTADLLQKHYEKLEYGEQLLSDLNKGVLSDIDVIPVVIDEIIYPPELPPKIRTLIEAAINSHNQQNYLFALQNFDKAREEWIQIEEKDLPDQINIFFDYSKAAVYSSAGRDDYALHYLMICKQLGDRLPYSNPDRALAYSGLGATLYNCEEYEFALRCFLKCREVRENLYGIEHTDTACTFNNLGCAMFMLERNHESLAYFKLAEAVFEAELGPFHNRTSTAARNIKKCEKGQFLNIPQYRTLWETYENDPYPKKGKKKGKKKKK